MIGLVVIASIVAWILLGYFLWLKLIRPRIHSWLARAVILLLLAAVWLIAPVADEILGAREFEKLCKEMPEIKFHGPVPVGPGAFFDEEGKPKRLDDNKPKVITPEEAVKRGEFIERQSQEWDRIIHHPPSEWRLLREWPMLIGESYSLYIDKKTGNASLETYARYSPGGWIKRGLGWGSNAPYQCPSKGYFPRREEWIFFAKETDFKSTMNGQTK